MFERYTEQARRAIFFARYEAINQPADKISPAHLLVGLARDAGSRADKIGSLKDNEDQLRTVLGIPHPTSHEQDIGLNDNSKMILAYAAKEAELDEEYGIDTGHLLRGILRFSNEATAALQSISLDLTKARAASKRYRIEFPSKKTLYHRLFGSPFRAHRVALTKLLIFMIVVTLATLLIRWIN
jgi:ATP-dependent Clp protease ATP-binding subunit ClpC